MSPVEEKASLGPDEPSPSSGKSCQGRRGKKRKRAGRARRGRYSNMPNGVNGEEEPPEYEVEDVLDHKYDEENKLRFFVKWKDWPKETNTWESFDNLKNNCLETLVVYFERMLGGTVEWLSHAQVFKKSLNYFTEREIEMVANQYITPEGDLFPDIDPEDLDEKLNLVSRLPLFVREPKFINELRRECLIVEVKKRRQFQLDNLALWEKELNEMSREKVKINVYNNVDLDLRPLNFKYMNEYYQNIDDKVSDDPPIGCYCIEDSNGETKVCESQTCNCLLLNGVTTPFYKNGLLQVPKGTPVFECNKQCKCGPGCGNRVLQRGRTVELSIFKTSNGCGWGVRTMERIQKGQFVTEYVGEVIEAYKADERNKSSIERTGKANTYLFNLDFNKKEQFPYIVDAAEYGNISHFINHSCSPNLDVYAVWVNFLHPDLPQLGLYANRTIEPYEELTFDYLCQSETDKKKRNSKDSGAGVLCKCNAKNCRTYLF